MSERSLIRIGFVAETVHKATEQSLIKLANPAFSGGGNRPFLEGYSV